MPAWIWEAQLAALSGEFLVAALDPRGQGDSEIPAHGYHVDRRADDLAEFIARYSSVVLVGWSLAALEALHCLRRNGDARIAALMLIDSSIGQRPAPPEGASFRGALRADRAATVEAFVRGMFAVPRPEEQIARLCEAAMRMPLEASLSLFPSDLPGEHWRSACSGFVKPLAYAVTPRLAGQGEGLKAMRPATRIEIFENAGHAVFVDEPGRFNALLADFARSAME